MIYKEDTLRFCLLFRDFPIVDSPIIARGQQILNTFVIGGSYASDGVFVAFPIIFCEENICF